MSMLTKEKRFQPEELQLANVRELDLAKVFWSPLPGYVPPAKEDAIAYCKFYSPWNPPFRWFGKVATDLFDIGLRFVMHSVDLSNMGQDGSHEIMHYWSVDGPGEFYKDSHWATCIETVETSDDVDSDREQ